MNERGDGRGDAVPPPNESVSEQQRFMALWRRVAPGAAALAETVYRQLAERYGEPYRHYHTLNHIRHCLRLFDRTAALMREPDLVEMALWFHDAIYQPGAQDNERRSANLFRQWAEGGMDPMNLQRVDDLIMLTTHRDSPQGDGEFVVDIDLSSFSLPWDECERDGRRVRAEFAELSDAQFYPGHLRFLRVLQSRPCFFYTDFFRRHYEQLARDNLHRIITRLQAQGYG
ncbi:MAG TPA: hypothetical protein PKI41_11880 [Candidatus Competibacteraceae bacterium]|nr:hypothetical protein [Candidatus Competibacteraceae bacterium]HQA25921.1 hypothetical protein [Candidatus Competibacteraceae bacterium]HQD56218.1 hypothetical protein [Candidatus Competibacteraceae bacterium]